MIHGPSRFALPVCAALAVACGGAGTGGAEGGAGHGVLLVAVDGLRADHTGSLGYDRPTTPTLDQLASEGVAFTQAFASSPLLLPAHVALLSGCDPRLARRFGSGDLAARSWNLPAGLPRLAVEFLSAGYRTAAFVDRTELDAALGLGRGFQRYLVARDGELGGEGHTRAQVRRLLSWVRSLGAGSRWFAYLHLADLERSWREPDEAAESYFGPRAHLQYVPPVGNTDDMFFAIPFSH
jgi:arylsulfatase A-like enzyme